MKLPPLADFSLKCRIEEQELKTEITGSNQRPRLSLSVHSNNPG
jgi:hypothetical protein